MFMHQVQKELYQLSLNQLLILGYHHSPRWIIHEALLHINQNDGIAVPNYPPTQCPIDRKRKQQDKPLPTPTSCNAISWA